VSPAFFASAGDAVGTALGDVPSGAQAERATTPRVSRVRMTRTAWRRQMRWSERRRVSAFDHIACGAR